MIPSFLIDKLKLQYKDELDQILKGYKTKRQTTIRVNTIKIAPEKIKTILKENGINYKEVPWSKDALIIDKDIKTLDIYEKGEIYMQSLSSQLPPIILDPKENTDILDMAASPGGKTTQIAALTNNKARITACEMNKIRMDKLQYNIKKQGVTSVYPLKIDSRNIDDYFSFDQILLDAPCSGSGTLNENSSKYFTEKLIQKSVKTQTELIIKAINILKPGGTLVYSTCSVLKEENEDIVNKALKTGKVKIEPITIPKLPTLKTTIEGTICLLPTEEYEGFFIAKLKKL